MSSPPAMPTQEQIEALSSIVGRNNALSAEENDLTHYTEENRGLIKGRTPLVLKPTSVEEVCKIVRYAGEHGLALVPQGGHTGHAGGAVPTPNGNEIVITLERMNRLRGIDLAGNTITVEAGMVLQNIQQIADEHDRLFPLSLAAEGSCMIGGNISTNAGGTGVLAYGNTRELVLGLEVVLANGEVWNGLRKLKKDNTGYHLKQLFIGAEGTLGIVTAAVLKLFPKPAGREVAIFATTTPDQALEIFSIANTLVGHGLTAFEIMPEIGFEYLFKHHPEAHDPFTQRYPWNLLIEISSTRSIKEAREQMEALYMACEERELVLDAVIGESDQQRADLWAIRETLPSSQKPEGQSLKHDVSVPVHAIPQFLERGMAEVVRICPGARPVPFGHMGDGNIHFNISIPKGMSEEQFAPFIAPIQDCIHGLVMELDGSVSAEHGIGLLKRDLLQSVKSDTELAMMRSIKQALDPHSIFNPGRIFEL